jgi:hypothetical protein
MKGSYARFSRKGQLKIQEMAFVVVALILFFSLAGIFLLNYLYQGDKISIEKQRQEKAAEIAQKFSDIPELAYSNDNAKCDNCVDFEKALILKEKTENGVYSSFWNNDVNALELEILYPKFRSVECTFSNYPECNKITIKEDKKVSFSGSYVSICRYDDSLKSKVCYLGLIKVSAKQLS